MITSYEFLATWLRARFDDEKGASLVEYALLLALIAIVCIGAITLIGAAPRTQAQQRRQRAQPTEPEQHNSRLSLRGRATSPPPTRLTDESKGPQAPSCGPLRVHGRALPSRENAAKASTRRSA